MYIGKENHQSYGCLQLYSFAQGTVFATIISINLVLLMSYFDIVVVVFGVIILLEVVEVGSQNMTAKNLLSFPYFNHLILNLNNFFLHFF